VEPGATDIRVARDAKWEQVAPVAMAARAVLQLEGLAGRAAMAEMVAHTRDQADLGVGKALPKVGQAVPEVQAVGARQADPEEAQAAMARTRMAAQEPVASMGLRARPARHADRVIDCWSS